MIMARTASQDPSAVPVVVMVSKTVQTYGVNRTEHTSTGLKKFTVRSTGPDVITNVLCVDVNC